MPHMKKGNAQSVIDSYRTATHDIIDLVTPVQETDDDKRRLKKMFKEGESEKQNG